MNRTYGLVALWTLSFVVGMVAPLSAQPGNRNAADGEKVSIFRPAPRDLTLALSRAKKAISEERYSDAVSELGRLLEESDEAATNGELQAQDYFVGGRSDTGTFTSLKSEAQRLLGSMPAKGREWYELQFGAQAKASLEAAVSKRDPEMLAGTSRRYFHTKAGYEATLLLGRHHLDHGRPLAAALCFKRLSESPVAGEYEPELSMLLGTSWYLGHMEEKAKATLESAAKGGVRQKIRVGSKQVDALPASESLKWLETTIGRPPQLNLPSETEWVMFRGNPTRTASSLGDLPLPTACWRVPTANNPRDEKLLEASLKQYSAQGVASIPSLQPLAVDNVVLMRTPDRLLAVDFPTGKRVWVFPWDEGIGEEPGPTAARRTAQSGTQVTRQRELSQRIWEDNPYGQLASDGSFVYMLDELGYAQMGNNPFGQQVFIQAQNVQQMRNRNQPRSYNQLVALEIKTQGKIQWRVGDMDGQDEPALAGAFFLGPPLPILGQLYVLAEFNGEVRLVVLNARTGKLEWAQQIAHLDNRIIQIDSMRRLLGATPSFSDGVLICPTSAGGVVAVDVATRSLLWGFQYGAATPETRQFGWRGAIPMPVRSFGSRWLDASATIADGRVVITPAESDELYCLDLLTGKPAWPAVRRDDHLFVGCVHDRKVVLVGKNKLTAIDLESGKPAWSKSVELPDGAITSGRGFFREGSYFVPTTASQLVQVDVREGRIAGQIATDGVLGNLICYRDQVLSHGSQHLAAYFSIPSLRAEVTKRLESNRQDPWALARLAELQLHDGKRDEGLVTLREAQRLDPQDDAIRVLLVRTLLDLLRTDYASHRELSKELEGLIDQPAQRVEFLRATAAGLEKLGRHAEAFEAFLRLAMQDAQAESEPGFAGTPREPVAKNLTVRHDRWVFARMNSLYAQAGEADRKAMDATIAGQWEQAKSRDSEKALRRFVQYFGFHAIGDQARLTLARRLLLNDELLEAEQILSRLESSTDRQLAAQACADLAALFVRSKHAELASRYLKKLKDDFADVQLADGKSGLQHSDEQFAGEMQELLRDRSWNEGRVEVIEKADVAGRYQNYAFNQTVNILEASGPVAAGTNVVADTARSQVLSVRDGRGQELVQANVARNDGRGVFYSNSVPANQARIHGHFVLAHIGTEVFAVSGLRSLKRGGDAVLWREDLSQLGESENAGMRMQTRQINNPWDDPRYVLADSSGRWLGQMGPLTRNGVTFQRGRDVHCVDPLSGDALWVRNDIDAGSELFGDDEMLFVVGPTSEEALVLSTLDGSELGRRKVVKSDARWTTRGRNVLTWTQADGRLKLRLFDAWTGKDLLVRDCMLGSKGCRIANEEFAVLQPDGNLFIASLDSGELRVSANLEPCANLSQLRVLRSQHQYHVIANLPLANPKTNVQPIQQPGASIYLQRALVYAFDRASGKTMWQVPAVIEQYSLTLDQPSELPVLTFFQQLRGNAPQTGLLCIDKRDGRILFQKGELPGQLYSLDVDGDLQNQTVTVSTPVKAFELKFTEAEVAPEPPAQTGTASTASMVRPGGFLNSITRLGKNLIGEAESAGEKKSESDKKQAAEKKDDDPFADP